MQVRRYFTCFLFFLFYFYILLSIPAFSGGFALSHSNALQVADVKAKIAKINAEDKKNVESIALIFNDNHLENDKTVGESKVENDNVVYLAYKKDGTQIFHFILPKCAGLTEFFRF